MRVSILHNPTPGSETPGHGFGFSTLLYRLNRKGVIVEVLPSELVRWIDLDLEADGAENHDLDPLDWGPEDPMTPFVSTAATPEEIMESHLYWRGLEDVVKTFGFKFGETGLLINGRVSVSLAFFSELMSSPLFSSSLPRCWVPFLFASLKVSKSSR